MSQPRFIPLPPRHDPGVTPLEAARSFLEAMRSRRSVRMFSDRPVDREVVETLVGIAGTAPSGANKQPWRFVAVQDPGLKRQIREAAEREERAFYQSRASADWLLDLAPLGTDEVKEYLEIAPWLVVVFRLSHDDDGSPVYYPQESVGIAVGFFLAAAHHAGLVTLTHTPNPMRFLRQVLGRPAHERPYLIIPLGYPSEDCRIPEAALCKKPLEQILVFDRGAAGPGGP